MDTTDGPNTARSVRKALATLGLTILAACTSVAQAAPYVMFRDPQCGCCEDWANHVRSEMGHDVTIREDRPMDQVKAQAGVPADLTACHTMEVDGYVIEGHVPAREIASLLRERPDGVRGLAVAGMPMGSPGMEAGGQVQLYQVIAFGRAGNSVYATYH